MKTLSLLAASLLLVAACNSGDQNREEEQTPANGGENITVDPSTIDNPKTASDPQGTNGELPVLSFEKDMYKFPGTIVEGESVSYDFKFTNTGKADLILSDVKASCGCTVPTFSKEPIPPGGKGVVKVEFNSTGKGASLHDKAVTVFSNAVPNHKELRIMVDVVAK